MVASLFQVVIGFSGIIGLMLRFIGPLSIAPTIALVGLSLFGAASGFSGVHWGISFLYVYLSNPSLPSIPLQGLGASSLQFTSPLEFNVIFRDGFTLRHELTAGSEIRDPVPAKFKHVTNIVTCMLLCCDYVTYVPALKFPKG